MFAGQPAEAERSEQAVAREVAIGAEARPASRVFHS